ncbi:hypothetical protein EDB84DRAFT_1436694 [Lactarius hengduanensis]|nr:hypothetical protein EDB84DRAFT_1436694 [Lactarius hengduanensis]
MLPDAHMRTLRGPTPTPFTGDPTQAQHFLDEFEQLVRANLRHPFIYRPELRVKLALVFIAKGLTTASWRRNDSGLTDETVWDTFLDSFRTAWIGIDPPVLSAPARAKDLAIPVREKNDTVTVSSPTVPSTLVPNASDTINSDLDEWALFAPRHKLVAAQIVTSAPSHDISIVLAADELSPQCLSETIDLTADDDETKDGSSLAPCTSALPPTSPRQPPHSTRATSPIASNLDLVKLIDEPPRPPHGTCRSASPTTPATTHDESSDPPRLSLVTSDLSTIASAAQHAEKHPVTTPSKRTTGGPSSPPHTHHDQAKPRGNAKPTGKATCAPYQYVQRRPVSLPPPVDDSSGLSTPAQLCPSSRPLSPADERPPLSLPAVIDLTLDDIDDAAAAVLFASPSPSPSLVPAPLLPAAVTSLSLPTVPSLFVVEDDNVLIEGVKTVETSVLTPDLTPHIVSPAPPNSYYPPIFLPRAFEQPRDPDEVMPVAPVRRIHAAPQNIRCQDNPRPPDVNEVTQHVMTRTSRRRPKSRKSSKQNRVGPRDVVDLTTPHALRRRPNIRFSEDHDRHASLEQTASLKEVATSSSNYASNALRERIQTWRAQIPPERVSLLPRPDSRLEPRVLVTNRQFAFPPDSRNYSYDYDYSDERIED